MDEPTANVTTTYPPKRVLIVEDEPALASALEVKLKHEGFEVAKAANGQAGLETASTFNPHVILLDLMMPVMDGKTMLRRLREIPQFSHLPVIILSNAGAVENIRETQVFFNASEFFIKSNVSLEEIVAKIKDLV
jgi:DNA-binding response OmpR family regulator